MFAHTPPPQDDYKCVKYLIIRGGGEAREEGFTASDPRGCIVLTFHSCIILAAIFLKIKALVHSYAEGTQVSKGTCVGIFLCQSGLSSAHPKLSSITFFFLISNN